MPIFEYICGDCRQAFEQLVRSETRVACPSCGSPEVEKRFSVPAPHAAPAAHSSASACAQPMSPGPCCGGGACSLN